MYIGTLYIQSQNMALKAFTSLTRSDIVILQQLSNYAMPVKFHTLYLVLTRDYTNMSNTGFYESLARLTQSGYVRRDVIGNNTLYSITTNGIQLLAAFNAKLESLVKEKIDKYGNGFNPR